MFPPFLYEHIVNTLKKHVILVLNKVDLVEPVAVLAWQNFFEEKYPNMPIVMFATFPKERKSIHFLLFLRFLLKLFIFLLSHSKGSQSISTQHGGSKSYLQNMPKTGAKRGGFIFLEAKNY